ncbi:type II toxin-antitoxin system PemK/MazF family toxin [Bartonella gliris]|uniref:type II toxin-antitoxin system PemK/MazF family toxin n=1 Tax=Bartonella gliris TaxID=3004109 RepID=UPI00295EE4DB|nr:type II toxin-antitoxin system PemK/MazF family toxin [Bartonella gliris]
MREIQPPRLKPRLKAAPRIRQILWCDFPEDAQLPEFWKQRPILVISKTSKLNGCVTVLPLTSKSQPDNHAAYLIKSLPSMKSSWIICNYLTTVAVSRLSATDRIPRLSEEEFNKVISLMWEYLPHPNH